MNARSFPSTLSKQASPASRRILDILKRATPEKAKETLERLSLLGRHNNYARPHLTNTFSANSELANKIKSFLYRRYSLKNVTRLPIEKTYAPKLYKAWGKAESLKKDVDVIPRKYSRHDIDTTIRKGRVAPYTYAGEQAYKRRSKVTAALKAGLGKEDGNLLAQYSINDPNIKNLRFTPHVGIVDAGRREEAVLANKIYNAGNSEWAARPNYETVISYDNIANPTKQEIGRLKPLRYFKPVVEGSPGSIPAASLPSSYEGFMYKGGLKDKLQKAKNLKNLVTLRSSVKEPRTPGYFYSGIPEVSAGYAGQATHVIPVGFRDLRRHLYPRSANREVNREINKNVSDYFFTKS